MENMTITGLLNDPDFNAWMEEEAEKLPSVWKKDNSFVCEIYADYRDELSLKTIEEILESPDPYGAFYETIMEMYSDTVGEYESEIVRDLMKRMPDDFLLPLDDDDIESLFQEWVMENIYFNLPEEHYLQQDVCANITVDVGEGNYDFCGNVPWIADRDEENPRPSSILWLMAQQGYEASVIEHCIKNPEHISRFEQTKFMESIHEECISTCSHMNALTFLAKMPLAQLIELNNLMEERNRADEEGMEYPPETRRYTDYIIITKNVTCGLYDPWYGAGSEMDIKLETDVILPIKFIDSAMPDGWRGYKAKEVYGVCDSWWEPNCVTVVNTELLKKEE